MADNEAVRAPERPAPSGFLSWVAVLVHEHRARLLALARSRGLDAEEALDAVQDSFVSFVQLPEARAIAGAPEDSLKLLTVILQHNVQNRRRKHSRRQRARLLLEAASSPSDGTTSDELIAQAEELARVNGCIVRMGRLQRSVVKLSLIDEQPREEVAKVLGISDGYLRVLVHRAREHLRSCGFPEDDDGPVVDEPWD
jgi:RNA polymerase sigma-70 factor (ECF subfamily)